MSSVRLGQPRTLRHLFTRTLDRRSRVKLQGNYLVDALPRSSSVRRF